jgi:ribosomal protein L25 (general stress protein Ctc)
VFAAVRAAFEKELPQPKPLLAPGGMLWVYYHKGTSGVATAINRDSFWSYVRSIGMEAVAQVAIDAA